MTEQMTNLALDPIERPSVADQVFDELNKRILSLELSPGARISETEVARALGTSRQPVRDAFFRLSKLGFLEIRPQRATVVSLISVEAVMEARFVRTAVEIETVREACAKITQDQLDDLARLVDRQHEAADLDDRMRFHLLDDQFHRRICLIAGHTFAWKVVKESKSHLDRVRMLSLSFNQSRAIGEHEAILDALKRRDAAAAGERMREHLSQLIGQIDRIRAEHLDYFVE